MGFTVRVARRSVREAGSLPCQTLLVRVWVVVPWYPQARRIQRAGVHRPSHQTFRPRGGKPSVPNPYRTVWVVGKYCAGHAEWPHRRPKRPQVLRRPRRLALPMGKTAASAAQAARIGICDDSNGRRLCAGHADWLRRWPTRPQVLRRPRGLALLMAQATRIGFADGPNGRKRCAGHAHCLLRCPEFTVQRAVGLPKPQIGFWSTIYNVKSI